MKSYIALLRGVNAGRVVKMIDLKACLEKAGLAQVTTVLQSGNVRFEASDGSSASALKRKIEAALSQAFGYSAKAIVMPLDDLRRIVANYPFASRENHHSYVIFLENGLERSLVAESYSLSPGERVEAGRGVVYWQVEKGMTLKSDFAKWLGRPKYRDFNTNRNVRTLQRLLNASN